MGFADADGAFAGPQARDFGVRVSWSMEGQCHGRRRSRSSSPSRRRKLRYVAATHAVKEALWLRPPYLRALPERSRRANDTLRRQPVSHCSRSRRSASVPFTHQTHRHPLPLHSLHNRGGLYQINLLPNRRTNGRHAHEGASEHESQALCGGDGTSYGLRGSVRRYKP